MVQDLGVESRDAFKSDVSPFLNPRLQFADLFGTMNRNC
jgi:hypothetical protein